VGAKERRRRPVEQAPAGEARQAVLAAQESKAQPVAPAG
jgi:hypothetical protein